MFGSEATSGSLEAKLPRSVKLHGSELLQFLGEPISKKFKVFQNLNQSIADL